MEADPGTEKSKEVLEKAKARSKERKAEWEKLLEKSKGKKGKQEKPAQQNTEGTRKYDITVAGADMGRVTEYLNSKIGMENKAVFTTSTVAGFDIKCKKVSISADIFYKI